MEFSLRSKRTYNVRCQPHVRQISGDFIITAGGLGAAAAADCNGNGGRYIMLARASEGLPDHVRPTRRGRAQCRDLQ